MNLDPDKLLLKHKIEFFSKLKDLMQDYNVESIEQEETTNGHSWYATNISFTFKWLYDSDGISVRDGDYHACSLYIDADELQSVIDKLQKKLDKS